MPIRTRDLRTRLLRASPTLLVGNALRDLRTREQPGEWLLIYPHFAGYVIVSAADLAQRWPADGGLLNRTFETLDLPASPTVDAEIELDAAQALLGTTGYVMVLRDDAPWGVLAAPAITAPSIDELLARVASWQPPASRVLGDEEAIPKTPVEPVKLEAVPARTDRYVNNDIATEQDPAHPLDKKIPLRPGQWYFLRVNVGELEASTIDETPEQLPDVVLKEDVEIRVVVFSERFAVPENENTGVLRVPTSGPASVIAPASIPAGMSADTPLVKQRLLFRIQAPAAVGLADLRVSMYCKGLLIQSRLISARVGSGRPLNDAGSQRSAVLDFNLSPTMAPRHLSQIKPHKLSMMLNSNSDGTHAFRLVGGAGQELFQNSVTLTPTALATLIAEARRALRIVAWGSPNDWDGKQAYRYELSVAPNTMLANMRQDLISLAVEGARLYSALNKVLGGGRRGAEQLRALMREPGMVQMASKVSANDVVPLAMYYDSLLDSQSRQDLTLCATFEASLASGRDLLNEPCFLGNCPNRDQNTIVCPSGFWGFRHDIGMPWPAPYGPEMATEIAYTGTPLMSMAFYQFPSLGTHLDKLGGIGFQTQRQNERDPTIAMLKTSNPHLVYFYCHGVLKDDSIPMLRIGSEAHSGYFETGNFEANQILWATTRPLVIINGCHTTALSPDHALSFVKSFVEDIEAAGVIGTEITIFEPLAQRFAETFLQLFFQGEPLGRAIRRARLQLLSERNPLGLVYDPFAYAGLKLVGPGR